MGSRAVALNVLLVATFATAASCSSSGGDSRRVDVVRIEQPTTWAEVDQRLDQVSSEVSMIAAEVADDGSFVLLHERNPDDSAAIGSAVSIYVLGMTTDRIAGGDLSWETPLPSNLTVSDAATSIIATSDGTAIDSLIDAVGRDPIEYLMASMGLGENSQARTLPLMTTREQMLLAAADEALRTEYVAADISGRREILRSLADDESRSSSAQSSTSAQLAGLHQRTNWHGLSSGLIVSAACPARNRSTPSSLRTPEYRWTQRRGPDSVSSAARRQESSACHGSCSDRMAADSSLRSSPTTPSG